MTIEEFNSPRSIVVRRRWKQPVDIARKIQGRKLIRLPFISEFEVGRISRKTVEFMSRNQLKAELARNGLGRAID